MTVKARLGLSMSLALKVMGTGVAWLVVTATFWVTGGSLTGFTMIETVAMLLRAPLESLAR